MSDEERERQMTFILEQQANLTTTVGRLSEKVDRTADSVTALLAIAEIHEREMAMREREIIALAEAQARTGKQASETDERLNALINTVERFISEGRNGKGR